MKNFLLFTIVCIFMLPGKEENIQRKILRQDGFDIECYVYIKNDKKLKAGNIYSWYKSQKIHETRGQSGGNLLHGEFRKYNRQDQLVEFGSFHYGLKEGIWREWYPSGILKRRSMYRKGYRQGKEMVFDQEGKIILEGKFSKNKKVGKWINFNSNDTLFYKNDSIYHDKPPGFMERFFKKIFHQDSTKKAQRKLKLLEKKEEDSLKKVKRKAAKEQARLQKRKEKELKKREREKNGEKAEKEN